MKASSFDERRTEHTRANAFFEGVIAWRRSILVASISIILAAGAFLPQIRKDTRSDAFIPPGHESLIQRDRVRDLFGLADPIVIAIVAEEGEHIFTPTTLGLVAELTARIEEIDGIDGARITSLATEDDIVGSDEGIEVHPFFEQVPANQAQADLVREAVMDFDLYRGSLVSEDARATTIVAELDPNANAGDVYDAVFAMTSSVPTPSGITVHVAGEGGVTGYLGHYINADARRMIPLVFVLVILVLSRAYRTLRSVGLPLLVVVGGVVVALGTMAGLGVPYYLITTALPVILVAIGVADGIHILGQYYHEMDRDAEATQQQLVVRSMVEMWQPVTITSLTDCAGFLALAVSTDMPPLRAFGFFAAIGVLSTWGFSLFSVPAMLSSMKRRARRVRRGADRRSILDGPAARRLATLGVAIARHPRGVLLAGAAVAGMGLVAATAVEIDYERIRNFRPEEPIHLADRAINRHLDGTSYLDVLLVADEPSALLRPDVLQRVRTFQERIAEVPHVSGSTSVVDYVRQLSRSMDGDRPESARVPDTREAVAQLLLLHEMQSEPDALEKVIDVDRRQANVRVYLQSGRYSHERRVVEAAQALLGELFHEDDVRFHLAGRVRVDHEWMSGVARSHFVSVWLALAAITVASALLFRSAVAGILTTIPVSVAVLSIYSFMAMKGLWLGITTAMFAAVAIGLGVDFSVHLIDRLRSAVRDHEYTLESAFAEVFPETGRALLFNFASCCIGFGVLATSRVPTLVEFGALTAIAVAGSFFAALLMIPALVAVFRPRFLGLERPERATAPTQATEAPLPYAPDAAAPTRRLA